MTCATESVLLCLENPAALKVLILLLNTQVNVTVNHVLKLIRSCHLAVLCDLADDDNVDRVFLRVRSQETESTFCRRSRDASGVEVSVVHALERVDDEEEGSLCRSRSDFITALQ